MIFNSFMKILLLLLLAHSAHKNGPGHMSEIMSVNIFQ